ncbi:hypothetical protein UA18_01397 [Burkholderia multivorans]|uniref:Peptidase S74 domain-containing protein n=1 Tax=Burkholderia multivorans TaxID=87883 RepID=A0ABD7LGJ6_9BURK|nr:hypothetical protein [Burkholderia multivorans]SAK15856.1 hypothetical protein UA18_01397 [Burkholderia multivorans]
MELSLILSDDTETYQAILGQFIESSAAETHADRILAQQAAETATNSANSALDSAGQAAQSAAASADSATQASASAAAASTSEQHASQYATAAQAASTDAAGSASSAASSASSATLSATSAANSATAASVSEQNAAATLTNALKKANNLSDVADAATALANLGGAPKASPTFTGNVGVPTRAVGDSTDNAASTKFVATSFLPRIGGTLTGTLVLDASTQANWLSLRWQLAGKDQWALQPNSTADFTLSRFNTDGTFESNLVIFPHIGGTRPIVFQKNVQITTGTMFIGGPAYGGETDYIMQNTNTYGQLFLNTSGAHGFYDATRSLIRYSSDTSGNFTATGNITAYSDESLKTDWADLPDDIIEQMAGVLSGTFTRIDTGARQVGVGAKSLRNVMPEAVMGGEKLSVAYGNAALALCVKLSQRVVELTKRVAALEAGK